MVTDVISKVDAEMELAFNRIIRDKYEDDKIFIHLGEFRNKCLRAFTEYLKEDNKKLNKLIKE